MSNRWRSLRRYAKSWFLSGMIVLLFCFAAASQENKTSEAPIGKQGPGLKGPAHDDLKLPVPRTFDLAHVDPTHYTVALGKDPQRIFEFVRDHVAFEVYPGCLRGPRGTLLAMAGNSVDRAALLAALLKEAGHSVRFAKGALPDAKGKQLVLSMWDISPAPPPASGELPPSLKAVGDTMITGIKRDFALISDHLKKAGKGPADEAGPTLNHLIMEAREHYWVQIAKDKMWIDLDPSFADAGIGQVYAKPASTFASLPDALFHRVALRIRVEESAILVQGGEAGKPVSRELLRFSAKAADLSGQDIVLVHQPENWKGPAADLQSALVAVSASTGRIKPVLLPGSAAVVMGAPFYYRLPPTKGLGGVGGLLGGAGSRTPVPVATAETLEVDFISPDGREETVIRELFDRAGPARRAAGRFLDAAEIRAQAAVKEDATSGIFSLFFTTGRVEAAHLRDIAAPRETPSKKGKAIDIRSPLRTIHISFSAISDGLLARVGKEEKSAVRFYPNTPRLQIAEFSGRDRRFTFDLRRDRVRAVAPGLSPESAFHAHVFRGVVEGSLERAVAELVTADLVRKETWKPILSTSRLFERADAERTGVALFQSKGPLPHKAIPEDALARVKNALSRGYWVIAPERALSEGGRERFAWWQIDPRSGETIAVTDDGLHGAGAETGGTYAVVSGGPVAGYMMVVVYQGGAVVDAAIVLATRVGLFLAMNWPNIPVK